MTAYYIYGLSISSLKSWKLCAGGPSSSTPLPTPEPTTKTSSVSPSSSPSSLDKLANSISLPPSASPETSRSTSSSPALFSISVHAGYTTSGPLGFDRPGVYLHNGPYRKDPVIAACGDHSSMSIYTFNNKSYVMLPSARNDGRFEESVMRAAVEKEAGRVVLGLDVDVVGAGGHEWRRERFEWRKVGKEVVGEGGGWVMVLLGGEGGGKGKGKGLDGEEVVAVLRWAKGLRGLSRAYTVEFKGRGLRELGERFQVTVVVTTAWINILRVYGRTMKGIVATGEKDASECRSGVGWTKETMEKYQAGKANLTVFYTT
ncbi:hypothetical protein B0T18DRAFT_425475 [Schizothecium vesticola]|uniref:Uncharacterized protein n=1 Tax=Schizothecium vesticola TaxID=314040 RepID=A0AA40F4A1_9PEZI|nr:hypothetical protein B0T18DRAFT_425475 [Schizothecium vesticola]